MRQGHKFNTPHSSHSCIPLTKHPIQQPIKQTPQHLLLPPAKTAIPRFGRDVAARSRRATLRAAVLQVPAVTLKMSTALDMTLPLIATAAQGRETRTQAQHATLLPLMHPPHKASHSATNQTNTTTLTVATSENSDSDVRQRCRCKKTSSYAESCSAPSSCRHVEDVYSS